MDDIGATILLAQAVVDRAGVKQNRAAIPQRIGNLEQFVRRQVRDDEAVMFGERVGCRGNIVALLEPHFGQREMLVEKLAGGVVVLDRKERTGDAVIFGGLCDQRQCRFDSGMAEIADADLERIGCQRVSCHRLRPIAPINRRIMASPFAVLLEAENFCLEPRPDCPGLQVYFFRYIDDEFRGSRS